MTLATCSSKGMPSLGALEELVAWNRSGEAPVLHLLDHRVGVDLVEAAVRADVRDRDDKAAHLVAGVDRLRQGGDPRHAGVVAVAQHRLDHLVRIAGTAQLLGSAHGVRLRETLVVEVVQQAGGAPRSKIRFGDPEAVLGVPANGSLDGEPVLAQRLARRPFGQ